MSYQNQTTMTNKEFRSSVASTAKRILKKYGLRYVDIKILHSYQLAYINGINGIYFQGDNFQNFFDENITPCAEKTGLNEKTCLLWFLDSAGAL